MTDAAARPEPTREAVLRAISAALRETVSVLDASAGIARDEATNDETRQEGKYDTRAIEASYLAGAQSKRADEARTALGRYAALPASPPPTHTVAGPALVTLVDDEQRAHHYFLGPGAGGLRVRVDGVDVLVITPDSPLGRALLGASEGDEVTVAGRPALVLARVS